MEVNLLRFFRNASANKTLVCAKTCLILGANLFVQLFGCSAVCEVLRLNTSSLTGLQSPHVCLWMSKPCWFLGGGG